MPQINKTPACKAGASSDKLGGASHNYLTFAASRFQGLIDVLMVQPDLAIMLQSAFMQGGANG